MTNKEKKQILAEYIEIRVRCAFDISDLICRPLNYFDIEKVKQHIEFLKNEYDL